MLIAEYSIWQLHAGRTSKLLCNRRRRHRYIFKRVKKNRPTKRSMEYHVLRYSKNIDIIVSISIYLIVSYRSPRHQFFSIYRHA